MGRPNGWASELTGRAAMRSPGRPPVASRVDRAVFWLAVGDGMTTVEAAKLTGVSEAVGVRWFRDGGGMPTVSLAPLSGRYLSFAEREEIALLSARRVPVCARSPGGLGDRRRRSPASCAATRLPAAGSSSTGRRSRSGRPNGWPGVRRPRSSRSTSGCGSTCRSGCPGGFSRPDGTAVPGPATRPWNGRDTAAPSGPPVGESRGALSRSPTGCDWTSPMMTRCGSRTRRSIRRSTSRAAERCKRELVACLRTGRALRVPRARSQRGKNFVSDEIMISERPAEARGPSGPRALGGRSDPRDRPLRDRDAGGALDALHDAAASPAARGPTARD